MILRGLLEQSRLAITAKSDPNIAWTEFNKEPCQAKVRVSQAFFEQDFSTKYRPYLHMIGNIDEIMSNSKVNSDSSFFSQDVESVIFKKSDHVPIDMYYFFEDSQLAELVNKGFFSHQDMRIPDEIYNSIFDIPIECDFKVALPDREGAKPIPFINIKNQRSIAIDKQNTGYSLDKYFENVVELSEENSNFLTEYDAMDWDMAEELNSDQSKSLSEEKKVVIEPSKETVEKEIDSENTRMKDLYVNKITPDIEKYSNVIDELDVQKKEEVAENVVSDLDDGDHIDEPNDLPKEDPKPVPKKVEVKSMGEDTQKEIAKRINIDYERDKIVRKTKEDFAETEDESKMPKVSADDFEDDLDF